jgi:hypothetical protein
MLNVKPANFRQGNINFMCLQEHFFAVPEPGRLAAKINW